MRDSPSHDVPPRVERFYDWMMAHRILVLLFTLALPTTLLTFAQSEFDGSLRIWFLDNDPDVEIYDQFLDQFENDEFVAIGVETPEGVFSAEALEDLRRLAMAMQEVTRTTPGAGAVLSIITAETIQLEGETLRARPLFEVDDSGVALGGTVVEPEQLAELRERVHGDDILRDLVARDDSAALVLVNIPHYEDLNEKVALVNRIRDRARQVLPNRNLHFGGTPIVDDGILRHSEADLRTMGPVMMLVIFLVTFLLFRSLSATLIPSLVVGLTLASTVGVSGLFQIKMNMITAIIIPLSLAVGIADCVHVLSGFRERMQLGLGKAAAMRSAWLDLLLPCLVTSLTTAAGLCALLTTNLIPLRQFGWMGSVSVLFALFYTLLLLPIAYSWLPAPPLDKRHDNRLLTRLLDGIARFSWRRHWLVIGGAAVVTFLAVLGLPRIEVGADFHRYFREDDPVRVDAEFIDEHLGGTGSIELLIETPDAREPARLHQFLEVEHYLEGLSMINRTLSPASIAMLLHERYFGDPDRHVIPASLPAAAQLFEMISGSQLEDDYLATDYQTARLSVRFRMTEYRALMAEMEAIESTVMASFDENTTAHVTGIGKLIANLDGYILTSQVRSFLVAFIIIGALICLMFRSFRFGLWALVPNGLPLVWVIGAMGWLGILLDVATVMIASILMGLIVDDTVHFLARYRSEERRAIRCATAKHQTLGGHIGKAARDQITESAIAVTERGTGRALISTSLILAIGFFTQYFSHFEPTHNFGLLTAIAILVALACDLIVLPAVMRAAPLRGLERASVVAVRSRRSHGR